MMCKPKNRKWVSTMKDFAYRFWWSLKITLKLDRRKWVIVTRAIFDDDQQIDKAVLPMLCPLLRNDGPLYVIDYLGFHRSVKYSHLCFLDTPAILSNRTIRKVIRAAESFVRAERNEEKKSYVNRCQRLLGAAVVDLSNPKPICTEAKQHLEGALDLIKEYPSREDYPELPCFFLKHLGIAIHSFLGLTED